MIDHMIPEHPIHVIHENPEWLPPFARAFAARGEAFVDLDLSDGAIDLAAEPPAGLFYNRMSASAHSRATATPEYAAAVIAWLEAHGRPVINGSGAISLEVNKAAQLAKLKRSRRAGAAHRRRPGRRQGGRGRQAVGRGAGHREAEPGRQGPRHPALRGRA